MVNKYWSLWIFCPSRGNNKLKYKLNFEAGSNFCIIREALQLARINISWTIHPAWILYVLNVLEKWLKLHFAKICYSILFIKMLNISTYGNKWIQMFWIICLFRGLYNVVNKYRCLWIFLRCRVLQEEECERVDSEGVVWLCDGRHNHRGQHWPLSGEGHDLGLTENDWGHHWAAESGRGG